MRATILLVFCIGSVAAPASDSGVVLAATSQPSSAESQVRRLSGEEVQAFLKRDSKVTARLWSDNFVVTNPLNQFVTKQQVLDLVESGGGFASSRRQQGRHAW